MRKLDTHSNKLHPHINEIVHAVTFSAAPVLNAGADPGQEAINAAGALSLTKVSTLSIGADIAITLADGTVTGTMKLVTTVARTAGKAATLTIAHHETADAEEATFNAVDEYLLLVWTGTEWATVANTCTFV